MFEARLEKGVLLKKSLEAIKDLVKQANFECTPQALQLQALDTSHVAMIKLVLRAEGFAHFRCDRNQQLGINTESLTKIFKCAENGDSITLSADDEGDTCNFVFESDKNDRVSQFGLKLMSIEEEQVSVPEMEFDAKVSLPSGEFSRICRDLSTIGETITITVNKTGIHFSCSGDLGTGKVSLKPTSAADEEEANEISIELQEEVSLRFAARYLCSFTKAAPLASHVGLNLAADSPLMVDFTLEDNLGCVQYYLAPKVDDEDEDEEEGEGEAEADADEDMADGEEGGKPEEEEEEAAAVKDEPVDEAEDDADDG